MVDEDKAFESASNVFMETITLNCLLFRIRFSGYLILIDLRLLGHSVNGSDFINIK